jgi:hypothetical protein
MEDPNARMIAVVNLDKSERVMEWQETALWLD